MPRLQRTRRGNPCSARRLGTPASSSGTSRAQPDVSVLRSPVGARTTLLDFDLDSDVDVHVLQGELPEPGAAISDARFLPPETHWSGNCLFRNELMPQGGLRFVDVTEAAGVGHRGTAWVRPRGVTTATGTRTYTSPTSGPSVAPMLAEPARGPAVVRLYRARPGPVGPESDPTRGAGRGTQVAVTGFPAWSPGPQQLPSYDYSKRKPFCDTRYQTGLYTRLGPAAELVQATDATWAIIGAGQEIHLELTASPAPSPGWSRRNVLEARGWARCPPRDTRPSRAIGCTRGSTRALLPFPDLTVICR